MGKNQNSLNFFSAPALYKRTLTGMQVWLCWAENQFVFTEWGTQGGAMQSTRYEAQAKNKGRANETTPEEQAIKEVKAAYENRLARKGYHLTAEEAEEAFNYFTVASWKPMKAKGGTKEEVAKYVEFPCIGQPKFDGFRCGAYLDEFGEIVFVSSRGVRFNNLPEQMHEEARLVMEQLRKVADENCDFVLDGELTVLGDTRQNTQLAISGNEPLASKLLFVIFDVCPSVPDMPYRERADILNRTFTKRALVLSKVVLSQSKILFNWDQACEFFEESGRRKEEGVILRNMKGLYDQGARSSNVLKWKHWQDMEVTVVGVDSAGRSHDGLAVLICRVDDSKESPLFRVTPEASHQIRSRILQAPDLWIGKRVTIRFQNLSRDGVPQHAIALDIRPDWDV